MKIAGNSPNVKQCNCNLVKWFLLSHGGATKPEIAEGTGISLMTVGKIVNSMLEEGVLRCSGVQESGLGRRAERFEINGSCGCSISVRFRVCGVDLVAADELGVVIREQFFAMPEGFAMKALVPVLAEFRKGLPALRAAVAGFPAAVFNGALHSGHLCQFLNVDVQKELDELFGVPVRMGRDLNLCTVGYSRRNLSPVSQEISPVQDMIYLFLDPAGYGAGSLVGGKVVQGAAHFAGEVGRMPLSDGRYIRQFIESGAGDEEYMKVVTHLLGAVTCVTNPQVAVFSGNSVRFELLDEIGRRLRERISFYWPGEGNVCPALEYVSDLWPDYRAGMVYLATLRIHTGVQMVCGV